MAARGARWGWARESRRDKLRHERERSVKNAEKKLDKTRIPLYHNTL
jgi:hypothetical protein